MAWASASDLLRDLVAWEHRHAPYGGHWPWDPDVLRLPGVYVEGPEQGSVAVIAGARRSVRRALWIAVWGELPDDVDLAGSCAVPTCVRPAHGHVLPAVGAAQDRAREGAVPLSLLRWDAAWGGGTRFLDRRGRTDLLGRHVPVEERRRSGVEQLVQMLELGERPQL